VRECPAKAIRVADGQAEVIPERCIGCGNCVRVCSQGAKAVLDSKAQVAALLAGGRKVAVCLAPSFPAEFTDCRPDQLVAMLRTMGFTYVQEVAFGADLVARAYRKLLAGTNGHKYIASTCPGIVAYVERYHPDLVACLAPIVSPMVAIARVVRRLHGAETAVVFAGPCIAKKSESLSDLVDGEVDAALTFEELRAMLAERGILRRGENRGEGVPPARNEGILPSVSSSSPSVAPCSSSEEERSGEEAAEEARGRDARETRGQDALATPDALATFDAPLANLGGLFAVSRGLLQTAHIEEDLVTGDVVTAEGRASFVSAIREFEEGHLDVHLLEVLCCHGCIMGAGMSTDSPLFSRRRRISDYVRACGRQRDPAQWQENMDRFADLDLSRKFLADDQRIAAPFAEEIGMIMARMGKHTPEDELNCGACGYDTCRDHAQAIFRGLAETQMCLPYTIGRLDQTIGELAETNRQLTSAQEALMQSEKLASMGQLAAGIAHEVNNPLGVVLMYSHLLLDEPAATGRMRQDLSMIAEQADRCKKIVSQLLHFARQNQVVLLPVDVRTLVERCMRALPAPEGVTVRVAHEGDDPTAELDADQIIQVLTNLASNAYAAMPRGGVLSVRTGGDGRTVRLEVQDTGIGIPPQNLAKIFEPFFTTKQIGKGTGLGLAVTYGIVKMHRGDVQVRSNADPAAGPTGTVFTVTLPRQRGTETQSIKETQHGQDSAGG
jgi:signal transduction histidine kinase/ferredoxin